MHEMRWIHCPAPATVGAWTPSFAISATPCAASSPDAMAWLARAWSSAGLMILAGLGLTARVQDPALPRGVVIDRVAVAGEPDESYALYLPSDYGPDRAWSLLLAFHPSARGAAFVELYRPAAERYGYVIAGSNTSRNGSWDVLAGGLPDPLPAMPYALVADGERLFAGLANGELWESRDRGDTWSRCELLGEKLTRLVALAAA